MVVAAVSIFSTSVFAQEIKGNVLNLDASLDIAIKNDYTVKDRESILEKAQKSHRDQERNGSSLDRRIEDNKRFKELANKSERTEAEEEEYKMYVSMYGSPMDDNDVTELSRSSDVRPVRDEFTIFQDTNAVQIAKNNVKQNVYEKYGDLIKAKDAMELGEKNFKVSEAEFKKIKLSIDLGTISKLEGKEKESSYLKEKEDYENLKREFKIATMNFNKTIGVPINTEYTKLSKEYNKDNSPLESYEYYVNKALNNRAEILNGKEYVEYKKYERDLSFGLYDDHNRERDIGVQYLETARDTLEIKKLDIQLDIKKLYDDLEVKYKNFQSIEDEYNKAKKDYDQISSKYKLGIISKIEYDKEYITFFQELVNYKNIERDIFIAKLKLENACSLGTDINKAFYSDR